MLSRDSPRAQYILQLRDIEPKNSHDESERDGREEIEVLCRFVESWWVMEDAKTARPHGREVEPSPFGWLTM